MGLRCVQQLRARLEARRNLNRGLADLAPGDLDDAAVNREHLHAVLQDRRFRAAAAGWVAAEITLQKDRLGELDNASRSTLDALRPQVSVLGAGILQGGRVYRADLLTREKDGSLTLTLFKPGVRVRERYLQEADWIRAGFAAAGFEIRLLRFVIPDRALVADGDFNEVAADDEERGADVALAAPPTGRPQFQVVPATHELKYLRVRWDELLRRVQGRLQRVPTTLEFEPAAHANLALCETPHTCPECAPLLELVMREKQRLSAAPREQQSPGSVSGKLDDSIGNLFRSGDLAREFERAGVARFSQIASAPAAIRKKLKARHHIQIACFASRRVHLDVAAILSWTAQLKYPVFFLDFESTSEAVPRYPGQRVWEHIPFAFSVTRLDSKTAEPQVTQYVAPPGSDPRPGLAGSLATALGTGGSILVYGAKFERTVLAGLSASVPVHAAELAAQLPAIVDLQEVFANFWYYHPAQGSRISLKALVPIFAPELDYANLEVSDGSAAAFGYYSLASRRDLLPDELALLPPEAEFLDELGKYSAVDTLALARIYRVLLQLCEAGELAPISV